ncbi:MAG: carboxypeptidase-like regulatory domain-containing protein [Bryobacteraceae bacterium]|nr:carboxypeptidase-like regulatory domain-containing protein [Bryobacteraceae bacterium]
MCVILLCLAFSSASLFSQSVSGILTGTVQDPSGAVIPGAAVQMRHDGTGDTRKVTTNQEGFFSIPGVLAGSYTVIVEAPGFDRWEQKAVVFNPGDKRNLAEIQLRVAGATTQAVVIAEAPLTPVDSGEVSAVISNRQLQNLSIVGRSATEFMKVLPGMAINNGETLVNRNDFDGQTVGINGQGTAGRQSAVGAFAANGSDTVLIVSDGAHVSDPACNCATPVNPNADMIQEMKVLTSAFGAENPKGPIVVNTVTKSGANTFHGGGYFYARHYAMNANNWLNNKSAGYRDGKHIDNKPESKYYYPGGNIGGPVLIPGTNFNRNRDKLFFFTGFEYYKQAIPTDTKRAVVPTKEMREGNFSPAHLASAGIDQAWGFGPMTDTRFPNGIIPASQMDPAGRIFINQYPMPNVDPRGAGSGYNYVKTLIVDQNSWQSMSRVDLNATESNKLFVRYNLQKETQLSPLGMWQVFSNQVPYPAGVEGKNQSQSVSGNYTRVFTPSLVNELVVGYTYIDFPNKLQDPSKVDREKLGYPYQGVFKNQSKIIPNVNSWGLGVGTMYIPGGFTPSLFYTKKLFNISDNLMKVWRNHTLKAGFYLEHSSNNQQGGGEDQGMVIYAPFQSATGNNYADMLRSEGWVAWAESSVQKPLFIAMRPIEFYLQDSWKATRRLTLEFGVRFQHMPAMYDKNNRGFAIFDAARYSNDPAQLPNRPGVLWNAIDSSVANSGMGSRSLLYSPRAGFAYDVFGNGKTVVRGGFGIYRFYDVLKAYQDALDTSLGGRSVWLSPWGLGGLQTNVSAVDAYTPSATRSQLAVVDSTDDRQPLTYSYNLTISQRLSRNFIWESAYVGSKSRNLLGRRRLNFVPVGALYANADGPESASEDNFRPMQNFARITEFTHNRRSNYNAFQTSLNRQGQRLNLMVNYTFSKAMGHRGGEENLGPLGETAALRNTYGPLSFDRTHLMNFTYSYDLPGLRNGHGVVKALVNGWQVSGISQFQSGVNLQANTNANFAAGDGLAGGITGRTITGTTDVGAYPRIVCNPTKGLGDRQYANGNCFASPSRGANGDYVFPYLKGPSFMNHDLSLFKNFSLSETRRLQFRASAFNFLNHPLWSFQGNDANLYVSWNADGTVRNPRFGYADTKYGNRVVQLALKYTF